MRNSLYRGSLYRGLSVPLAANLEFFLINLISCEISQTQSYFTFEEKD